MADKKAAMAKGLDVLKTPVTKTPVEDIGTAVKKFTSSNASFTTILDKTDAQGSTWSAGGCWILADAVQKKFGGELYSVTDKNQTQHIVTKIGDKFIDADGVSTKSELLNRMKTAEGHANPKLEPLDPTKVSADIVRPTKQAEISAALDKHLASGAAKK